MLSNKEQKFIKSLKVKKYRTLESCFLIEGSKNVGELLSSHFEVVSVIATESFYQANEDKLDGIDCKVVKQSLLEQLGTFKTNNAVLAVAKIPSADATIAFDSPLFVLDQINDPGNLGTIIRTLDWFGYTQVVCSENCVDVYHPKVVNSTMGSFTRVASKVVALQDFLPKCVGPVYAADMDGSNLFTSKLSTPCTILMGSESHGVSNEVMQWVTEYLSIPQYGGAESLNVGVATGIIASYLRIS